MTRRLATATNLVKNNIPFGPFEEYVTLDSSVIKSEAIVIDGESRPLEDTPSAAEMQFFGNLRTIGQVKVDDPDQVKHHEVSGSTEDRQPNPLFLFFWKGSRDATGRLIENFYFGNPSSLGRSHLEAQVTLKVDIFQLQ